MTTYKIGLIQTVTEETTVFVEATTRVEAEKFALQKANDGDVEWRFLEANEPIQVVSISAQ